MKPDSYDVIVLRNGMSSFCDGESTAVCSIVLITGPKNIIVDPGSAWDRELILEHLRNHQLSNINDIDYVIGTHGHSDHVGNLNLFPNAVHLVGFEINKQGKYVTHRFDMAIPFEIDEQVIVMATPGHSESDVSVLVKNVPLMGNVVIAGDIFECERDISNAELWQSHSSDDNAQITSRRKLINMADVIIPGHGPMFHVTDAHREMVAFKKSYSEC